LGSVKKRASDRPLPGADKLVYYIDFGRAEEKATSGGNGLAAEDAELVAFKSAYAKKKFNPAEFHPGRSSLVSSELMQDRRRPKLPS
jgi:hypothetical protein